MAYNNLASKKLMFQFRRRKFLYIISQLLSTISKCRFMCIASVAFVSSLVTKRANTPTTLPNMLMSGSKLIIN